MQGTDSLAIKNATLYCIHFYDFKEKLTLNVPCISESCIEIKIKLNFYFHTYLWCLKRFYEGLFSSSGIGTGRVKVSDFGEHQSETIAQYLLCS